MKYLPAATFIIILSILCRPINANQPQQKSPEELLNDDWLSAQVKSNSTENPKNYTPLFDPEFSEIREKKSKQSFESVQKNNSDPTQSTKPQSTTPQPNSTPRVNSQSQSSSQKTSPTSSTLSTSKPPKSSPPKRTVAKSSPPSTPYRDPKTIHDPKDLYDPKDLQDPKALNDPKNQAQPERVIIKEDIREGRFYVTMGIGGVVGTTSTKNLARVDNDAFQKASAAAYQGNSLTARFGRVDSDIALVGMIGAGYDSSIRNRSLGYSIGLEYLYQDKTLFQHYTTHDAFGNTISHGKLEVGETHYIMAKFLGKYRIDSWMPYIGIGGGMAIYNIQDKASGGLHLPIFGNKTHAAPVIMPVVGLEYDLNQDWSITGEYKFLYIPTATFNKELQGKFKSLETHNLIIGAKYGF